MIAAFLFLLFLTDKVYPDRSCSYQDVLNHLNLTKNNELFSMTRPVKNYKKPTRVYLEVLLYAILDVVEKDQKFIPYVWTVVRWHNEYISWDPKKFCGIDNVSLPIDILWKPDLTIEEEMTEKDKAPPSPYLSINNKGDVEVQNDQVLVSTCRMHIYKFPFDTQKCNLSFKSVIHTAKDIRLQASDNSSEATEWSREVMRTQYEWLFISMTVTSINASTLLNQDVIIYTITMKRRSVLYIVNFLLPVFFFLCLDLASFMISDTGGEKLSFQVTVLLAVTVLQLILNEILPSSSNRIPLIAVYCIGIFALMLLSLLETIFVMYLINKDKVSQDQSEDCNKQGKDNFYNCHGEVHKWSQCLCIYDAPAGEITSELLPVAKEGSSSKLTDEYSALEKLSDELRKIEETLSLLLSNRKEKEKPRYWTRVAQRFNRVFFIVYVIVIYGASSERNCSYVDILNYLNLTKDKDLYLMTRPVKNYKQPTEVTLLVLLYAILSVRRIRSWFLMFGLTCGGIWPSEHISWDPDDFCGIKNFTIPTEVLWKPDLTIEEMTEKDKAPPSPYLVVYSDSYVEIMNDQMVVSTCRMHVYRFPFDTQRCKLSFKSVIHQVDEIQLAQYLDSSKITEWTLELMRTQYEWLFVDMTATNKTVNTFGFIQSVIVYTITIKRRSALYILNFMLPILFFLCLDLASFMISDTGGEKLSFKITVLLAVTVLQLILNEILPASSTKIPLIDSISEDDEADGDQSQSEDCEDSQDRKTLTLCLSVCDVSPAETQSKSVAKEGGSSQPTEEYQDLKKLSDELKDAMKTLAELVNDEKKKGKPGYWRKLTKKINRVFFIFYVIAASLFLGYGESSEDNCSAVNILNYLNLTKDMERFLITRPVKNHKHPTVVTLDMLFYAILDVKEKEQKLVSYIWTNVYWQNEHISWDPNDFCGIENFTVPAELLWKPDLTIEEMTEKDKTHPSPYVLIYSDSYVGFANDVMVVSTCRMRVYRFPFDTQSCNLSFKSVLHTIDQLQIVQYINASEVTDWALELLRSQYEWLFINMTATNTTVNTFGLIQSVTVYTITIKRKSALYILNFMLPILFFLCLDLASFMISDTGGEKLSFKITVLLAVTVLQLILNEILPASSSSIPLIVIYCMGIFALMMLSLLETVLVMYLIKRDSISEDDEGGWRPKPESKLIYCLSVCNVSSGEMQSELLTVAKEGGRNQPMEESQDLKKLSDEMRDVVKTLAEFVNGKKKKGKPGYWKRMTKRINRVFFIFYVITLSLFLGCMFFNWTNADGASSERNCSYIDIVTHLNLTKDKDLYLMTRPVKNYKQPTEVTLDVLLYAILDVKEKEQKLIPYVWIDMWWQSEHISWDPDDFCGIENFSLPAEVLWKPDLTIEEMTEKDKAPPSPYVIVYHDGNVELTNDKVLISTCRMHIYKFPFDIQSCNLSFKSVIHTINEIQLVQHLNSTKITEWTQELMRTQYEWLFINMTAIQKTVNNFDFIQSVIIYTIRIKRRSALYIVNFMLPVFFFLCLDLASFMISDTGGEKLAQLQDHRAARCHAVYCIGIFGLMMLSLLETVLVMYLIKKDSISEDDEVDGDQSQSEDCEDSQKRNKLGHSLSVCNVSLGDMQSELLPVAKEVKLSFSFMQGGRNQPTEESQELKKLSDEMRDVVKILAEFVNGKKKKEKEARLLETND
ncbi:hypothetical protein L3Q82_010211 [Scortum barcoo]|uniref:Uncharacterized protein n=1 Tax=Scortum barcoo TaxID=214431 RepID=A0ACB8WBG1_9TELE|nr:hypothetical protein L3Q82_010211 [Scortum barcoo]